VRQVSEHRPADEVFGLLSDRIRVDILRAVALAQHERAQAGTGPVELAFSEIYDRVDVDSSSKLSYHLGELAGTFLRKGPDGYSFTHAGERIVRFVLSRNYEEPPAFGPRETAGTCPFCGAETLEASLRRQFFRLECASCDRPVGGYPTTPAQVRSVDESSLVRQVGRTQVTTVEQLRRGTCPECAGQLSTDVREVPEAPLPDGTPFVVVDRCGECLRQYNGPLTYRVVYHPASVAFHWDRGIDVTSRVPSDLHGHVYEDRWTAERVSTDPEEYEVTLRRGDDSLRVRLDATATVTRTERIRRSDGDGERLRDRDERDRD
jgi:hypothetical protein